MESDRPQMKIWRMYFAYWIPKATKTHSEGIIIIAIPLQHWLHGRASVLFYTYITCRVHSKDQSLCEL